jgi:Bacteriophage Lambda NinG protein
MSKLPEKKKKKKVKKLNKGDWYDAVDVPFNAYIRNRDKNHCVICGSTEKPQCGHVIPKKSHINIRWDEENAFCQCGAHNTQHNYDPSIYTNWLLKVWPGRYETLCLRYKVVRPEAIDYRAIFIAYCMKCMSIGFDIRSFILNSPYYKQKVKKVFPDIIEEWQKGS